MDQQPAGEADPAHLKPAWIDEDRFVSDDDGENGSGDDGWDEEVRVVDVDGWDDAGGDDDMWVADADVWGNQIADEELLADYNDLKSEALSCSGDDESTQLDGAGVEDDDVWGDIADHAPDAAEGMDTAEAIEAERLREQLLRRSADERIFQQLKEDGFVGPRWERWSGSVAEYAITVVRAWLRTKYIFKLSAARGRPVGITEKEALLLATDAELRLELALDIVAFALHRFRESAIDGDNTWTAEGGAGLPTYFTGACVLAFPNVFRKAQRGEERWNMKSLASLEPLPRVFADFDPVVSQNTVGRDPSSAAVTADELRRHLGGMSEREKAVFYLLADGWTYDDIAGYLTATRGQIKGIIQRFQAKQKRAQE